MAQIERILGNMEAVKRKIDSLTVDVAGRDHWAVHVDLWTVEMRYGDFWNLHQSLSTLARNSAGEQLVTELGMSIHQVRTRGKMCKRAYTKLNYLLEHGIGWLEELRRAD
jgi:hypothetical protein